MTSDEFREVISHFASGVTVITALHEGRAFGTTASAVTSLSLEPPMLLVCMNKQSETGRAVAQAGQFAVNILGADQVDLAERFAQKGGDKFAGVPVSPGKWGEPLFEELKRRGLIRHWGVSNFDVPDIEELVELPAGRDFETDQVLYNLAHRGIEWNLLPWCRENGVPVMAYSPIEQGRLIGHPVLRGIGVRHKATSAQVAVAWVIRHPGVCAIPEAGTPEHVRENAGALGVVLHEDDVVELDAAFPPPSHPVPLEVR